MGRIEARVGGTFGGYSVWADVQDNSITGRIGGSLFGSDINIEYSMEEGYIRGRIGGSIIGRSLEGRINSSQISARIGGAIDGYDIQLCLSGSKVTGRCGGNTIGFSVDVDFYNGNAIGRLGGNTIGHSVDGRVSNVEPIIAATIFAITYYMYRVNNRSSNSAGSGNS